MAIVGHREYETIYILRPNADEDTRTNVRNRVESVIEAAGGHILKFDEWGVRRLAYRIRDSVEPRYHEQGNYQYYRFIAPPSFVDLDNEEVDVVAEIERNLGILDPVIKYISVKLDEHLDPEERLNRPEKKIEPVADVQHADDEDDDEDDD